jgi:hypothetical protein
LLRLLRVLPGQRYVGAGIWRGTPVLAKLLVGSNAARHFQRELDGVKLLAKEGLTTPQLLADGLKEGEGGWLLFEFLDGAESLADAWAAVENLPVLADEQHLVLGEALTAVAQMHAQGLWQEDLHLDNLLRHGGKLYLIDEALTPDSSRFWPKAQYRTGISPPSFDKQFVRDYLETLSDWNKTAPAPALPQDVIEKTQAKYFEAIERLTGEKLKA